MNEVKVEKGNQEERGTEKEIETQGRKMAIKKGEEIRRDRVRGAMKRRTRTGRSKMRETIRGIKKDIGDQEVDRDHMTMIVGQASSQYQTVIGHGGTMNWLAREVNHSTLINSLWLKEAKVRHPRASKRTGTNKQIRKLDKEEDQDQKEIRAREVIAQGIITRTIKVKIGTTIVTIGIRISKAIIKEEEEIRALEAKGTILLT